MSDTDYAKLAQEARLDAWQIFDGRGRDVVRTLADAIDAQAREIQRLRAALESYAHPTTYLGLVNSGAEEPDIVVDQGARARAALAKGE